MNRKERKKALFQVNNLIYVMAKIHLNSKPESQQGIILLCENIRKSTKAQHKEIKEIAQRNNKFVWQLTEEDFNNHARECLTNLRAMLETNNSKTTNKKA